MISQPEENNKTSTALIIGLPHPHPLPGEGILLSIHPGLTPWAMLYRAVGALKSVPISVQNAIFICHIFSTPSSRGRANETFHTPTGRDIQNVMAYQTLSGLPDNYGLVRILFRDAGQQQAGVDPSDLPLVHDQRPSAQVDDQLAEAPFGRHARSALGTVIDISFSGGRTPRW